MLTYLEMHKKLEIYTYIMHNLISRHYIKCDTPYKTERKSWYDYQSWLQFGLNILRSTNFSQLFFAAVRSVKFVFPHEYESWKVVKADMKKTPSTADPWETFAVCSGSTRYSTRSSALKAIISSTKSHWSLNSGLAWVHSEHRAEWDATKRPSDPIT